MFVQNKWIVPLYHHLQTPVTEVKHRHNIGQFIFAMHTLSQIYSVDWTDVYDTTLNTEQNQLTIKVSADN